ncbi:MAG: DUF11 domain-containing protein [Saprospiraceae bacterium]|nr:DUF11 domain-containing protein [Saprospiraceae bacterium]
MIDAANVTITDYIPAGMSFVAQAGWVDNFNGTATGTITGPIAAGDSAVISIQLEVNNPLVAGTSLVNWAEITSATDADGNPQTDTDSTPDDTNDDTYLVDNDINGNGNNGEDEDDHDQATVVVKPFDLALFKKLANGQSAMVEAGDDVIFTITLVNQGEVTATDIEVTDFVPANMTFAALSNHIDWSEAAGIATRVVPGPLAPGQSTSIDIVLNVNSPLASGTEITNWAEISDAKDTNGVSQPDIDSNPDANNNDLSLEDNDIDGDGKNGGDEDDHDPASVIVEPFDLALVKKLGNGQSAMVSLAMWSPLRSRSPTGTDQCR